MIQDYSKCDFDPASADILPNRKNKRRSNRQAWGAAASCSWCIRRKIGMRRSAFALASRSRRPDTRGRTREQPRSLHDYLWTTEDQTNYFEGQFTGRTAVAFCRPSFLPSSLFLLFRTFFTCIWYDIVPDMQQLRYDIVPRTELLSLFSSHD